MEKIICDTNIISRYLIGKHIEMNETIKKIGLENIYITPIIRIELLNWISLYQGIGKVERDIYKKTIKRFPLIHLNEEISHLAIELSDKKTHSKPGDTLIGATALYHKIRIYTYNQKDFELIGVPLYKES